MDRVFENSTKTHMPSAVIDDYLTEAPEATLDPSIIESNVKSAADLPPA